MNFLAHLLLADVAQLPLAGGVLGDVVRGPVDGRFPQALGLSIRLHRRVDTVTDAHPAVEALTQRFESPHRRYAGVLLDLLFDHVLARQWSQHSDERFGAFCKRGAREVGDAGSWFTSAGAYAPSAFMFERLLRSYALEAGMSRAIRRTASRLRRPEGLIDAAENWTAHLPALNEALPILMADLKTTAQGFVAAESAAQQLAG